MENLFNERHLQVLDEIPSIDSALNCCSTGFLPKALLVCDTNTTHIAKRILGNKDIPLCILPAGEKIKNWNSIENILFTGLKTGLGRDDFFIAVGGGVISDITAFASSIYMRGTKLCIISTSLLGMVDAAVGGKTGIDLFGIKNMVGTFYPANSIFMPLESLYTLPEREWKSGMAEVIKTAILDTNTNDEFLDDLTKFKTPHLLLKNNPEKIRECILRAILIKENIVKEDPEEKGSIRALLNLGHTFAHALESSLGFGKITHGEAVAWGIARACELGFLLGITPSERKDKIINLLCFFNYEIRSPHPLIKDFESFFSALFSDKKKRKGQLYFVVPEQKGAILVSADKIDETVLMRIIKGV